MNAHISLSARHELDGTLAAILIVAAVASLGCTSGTARPAVTRETTMTSLAQPPVLLPVSADPTVSFRISFSLGSQDDPPGKEGLAYLTATMMVEGATTAHSYPEILKLLYPMAAGYDVRIDKERTTFSGRVHRDNLDAYTTLLLDALMHPAFAEDDFLRLKQRTLDTITKTLRFASDEELGKAVLYDTVFAGTPYGHLTMGTVAGLESITLADVRAFWNRHFTRESVTVGLGGGFDPSLLARLTSSLTQLPAAAPPTVGKPGVRPIEGRKLVIVSKPGPATAISFGFPIPVLRGSREFYALWLANSWLGEHRNSASHLYQVIREDRGMNYGDYSYIEFFPEAGSRSRPPTCVPRRVQLFEVWIRPVQNAQAHFALRAAVREVERLAAHGLSEEEFELTKGFLAKYCLHFAETTSDRLGYALDDRAYGIPSPGHLANFRAIIPTLTRDEVNAAIRSYIKPDNMVIAMVSQDAQALADAIAAEKASPITYATPKPPEVLAEDEEIQVFPLHISKAAITVVPVEQAFAR